MNARPPDGSDEPEAVDQVMLAVLSNRGRNATVLSAEQERLVDDWMAGRLAPDDAERAAALVRQNALAAERVLERRLQAAASESPPVPQQLTAQILKASAPPKASAIGAWWRSLGRWQWTSVAGAAALASILVVAGMPLLQQMMSGGGPLQVAMVTISDRGPLFEASDLRMRGTTPPPGPVTEERFRDVEMPTAPAQGPRCDERPGQERNVARDRALCPRHRRDGRSSHPRDRRLLPEAKDRHGRSRSHACARLRSWRSAFGRHEEPRRPAARERTGFPAHRQAMTPRLAALARRWIGAFGVLAGLAAACRRRRRLSRRPINASIADIDRVIVLLRAGRNLDAVDLAKRVAAAAPPSERQFVYQWAGWVCRVTLDVDCARDILATALPHLDALLRTPGARSFDRVAQHAADRVPPCRHGGLSDVRRAPCPGPHRLRLRPPSSDPLLFAELQLLAARRARRLRISRHRATISTRRSSPPFP